MRGQLHLERLERSARALGLPFDLTKVGEALAAAVREKTEPSRVRIFLGEEGTIEVTTQDFVPQPSDAVWRCVTSEHGVASGANIFVQKDGRLLTPPLSSGALPGCLRQDLLARGECHEAVLTPADLATAESVFIGNSLRGLIRAIRFA